MICPRCHKKTARMVYTTHGKMCPDCHRPDFINILPVALTEDAAIASLRIYQRALANLSFGPGN